MSVAKSQALRKKKLAGEERGAIRDYSTAIKKAKGKERATYKHILPEEQEHLKEIKRI